MKMLDNEEQKQFYVATVVKIKSVTAGVKRATPRFAMYRIKRIEMCGINSFSPMSTRDIRSLHLSYVVEY
jgi:hypothetical protein